jgi:putative flavoprotein involved in K+ transport|tara:strand:+ start:2561 stop:3814 length:1254 start_codon:yes stop_codon:yes gene_type:complete
MEKSEKVIIIGAGQAGLSVSYYLTNLKVPHLILEKGSIGNSWKNGRWDSFCLVTPNWTINLPGKPYAGEDKFGFMKRDDFVKYLEDWAESFCAPIKENVEVKNISGKPGLFKITTNIGTFISENVVIATATYQKPRMPNFINNLPKNINFFHAETYKNPQQIKSKSVLVIGSGQTGCQIVDDLLRANFNIYFSVSSNGRLPRTYRGKDCIEWQNDMLMLDRTPDMLEKSSDRFKGDPHLSGRDGGKTLSLHDFRRKGVKLIGKVLEINGFVLKIGRNVESSIKFSDSFALDFYKKIDDHIDKKNINAPLPSEQDYFGFKDEGDDPIIEIDKLDLQKKNISTIILATGFSFDFNWVNFPILDDFGYPITKNGETEIKGIYFCGLNWMNKRKSGIIWGVGEDAEIVSNSLYKNLQKMYA